MVPEFGQFAIILAFCLALVQATVPLWGAYRNQIHCMQLARYTAWGQLLFVGLSFTALAYSFLTNDFSVAYVAENSNTNLPLIYRFCAVWGAHEGSLLLWILILSIWTAAVSVFSRSLPLPMLARVLAVLAIISVGFDLFLLVTSDPFQRLLPNFPTNGADLNPILQDPGLAVHPPMLYMGYVGFSVAFAFAIAALLSGRLDSVWARWSRPWTQVAWCFLTYGIVAGSWWAYRELGWGGFWFWDPVENASFLPWLAGTALMHSLIVTEKRDAFKAWTVLLAVCTFSLCLLGTFLVRSGILISVHAFAIDPKRGLFLLRFLLLVVGGSLALYAWRAKQIVTTGHFNLWSRETVLLANNVMLFVGMLCVLLGTLYPLIIAELHLGKLSVGAPYFNSVFVPLMVPLIFLMGIGPLFHWYKMDPRVLIKRALLMMLIIAVIAILLPPLVGMPLHGSAVLWLFLALWLIANTLSHLVVKNSQQFSPKQRVLKINWPLKIKKQTRSQWAMVFAHMGVGVTVIGLAMTTAYSQQRNLSMKPGDVATIGAYRFQFEGVKPLAGADYSGVTGTIAVYKNHQEIALLHPQVRDFPVQHTATSKTSIDVGVFRDLYVALGTSLGSDAWSVRIYYKPFIRWIWIGGLLMVVGGIFALSDRRYRLKQRGL